MDLLGFERLAEGLAARLAATPEGGFACEVHASSPGGGRTSFLGLVQLALATRGVAAVLVRGEGALAAVLGGLAGRAGLPPPVLLVDDAPLAEAERLAGLPATAAPVVAAFPPGSAVSGRAALALRLPAWDAAAAGALAARLAADPQARASWARLLAVATTPRDARRLADAALTALGVTGEPLEDVLAAVAAIAGRPVEVDADLLARVAPVCAGLAASAVEPAPRRAVALAPCPPEPSAAGGPPRDVARSADAAPSADDPDAPQDGGGDAIDHRRRRCDELVRLGGPEAAPELVRLLADDHAGVRLAAGHALASLGDRGAAPAVRPLLRSPEASVRRGAAFVLGQLTDGVAVLDLVALLSDPSAETRRVAAAALGRIGGPAATRGLLGALDDGHAGVRMAADTALRRLAERTPDALDVLLRDPSRTERAPALAAATRLGVGSADALHEIVRRGEADAGEAALALASRGDRGAEAAIVQGAAAAPPEARAGCLQALARVAGRPAVERLVELLAADDAELADAAGRALAGARGAVPAVAEMLDAPDPLLRSRAVRILGLSGDPAAIEVLLAAHARGDAEQRREAAAGLVRLGYGATRG